MTEREDHIERINAVAEMLGLTPAALLAAAQNAGSLNVEAEDDGGVALPPPPIVYPNVKFKPYKFREYPKLAYRGYVRDVEETVTKLMPREGGGVDQKTFIRVIPDQFVMETRELKNKAEENTLSADWFLTLVEAKEAAQAAKANQRPIVEREAPAEPVKRGKKVAA